MILLSKRKISTRVDILVLPWKIDGDFNYMELCTKKKAVGLTKSAVTDYQKNIVFNEQIAY